MSHEFVDMMVVKHLLLYYSIQRNEYKENLFYTVSEL